MISLSHASVLYLNRTSGTTGNVQTWGTVARTYSWSAGAFRPPDIAYLVVGLLTDQTNTPAGPLPVQGMCGEREVECIFVEVWIAVPVLHTWYKAVLQHHQNSL